MSQYKPEPDYGFQDRSRNESLQRQERAAQQYAKVSVANDPMPVIMDNALSIARKLNTALGRAPDSDHELRCLILEGIQHALIIAEECRQARRAVLIPELR